MITESQNKQILNHLTQGNTLTAYEALNRFKCFRLAARVNQLKNKGHNIKSKRIRVPSGANVSEYYLDKE